MYITRQTSVLLFVGLAAVVTIGLTVGGEGLRHVVRRAEVPAVDCDVGDPSSACFAPQLGYSMGDLFIWGPR
jgi:hypothetical protein